MIQIYLSRQDYEYDIRTLVQAFYPKEMIGLTVCDSKEELNKENCEKSSLESFLTIQVNMEEDSIGISLFENGIPILKKTDKFVSLERKAYKNILKRLLYQALSEKTSKQLPWGTLTGIRPTKLTMKHLEEGDDEKKIKQFLESEYLCSKEKADLSLTIAKRELDILNGMDYKNGYSIYIGIPFCPTTCLYCSFPSYSIKMYETYVEQYLNALFKEIEFAATCFKDRPLNTIYFGGGTPTTLSADQLERLLKKVSSSFPLKDLCEFTVEAGRPDSITMDKLKVLKEQGVSRISINPQTMNQKTLDLIGRKHTTEQIIEAFNLAREAGHDNINMDLIIGLPGETSEDVKYTLEQIEKLAPDSLTIHTLAIKRAANLNIYKDLYQGYEAKDATHMMKLTEEFANKHAYEPYYLYRQKNMADNLENIGYARHGKEGIYNILIMEEKQNILALGAAASSKFVFLEENRIERVENVKNVKEYVERIDEMIARKRLFMEREF